VLQWYSGTLLQCCRRAELLGEESTPERDQRPEEEAEAEAARGTVRTRGV
jgi:hypothetical protein